ncbi:hypothetical protein ACLOJK_040350 [Asimina triloba]
MGDNDLPPGFVFVPEGQELIESYLQPLCDGILDKVHCSSGKFSRGNEWYFFSELKKKSESDQRIIRSVKGCQWKDIGSDTVRCKKGPGGKKKAFTFYEVEKNYVLCKLRNNKKSSCEDNNDNPLVTVDASKAVSPELSEANHQVEHCDFVTAVGSPFSTQLSQGVPSNASQAMGGNDYPTAMNEDYQQPVQHLFPVDAVLSSTPNSSSEIMASLGMYPTAAYCNQAISLSAQVVDTPEIMEVDSCWMNESLQQQVFEAYMHDQDSLQTFQEQLNEEQWRIQDLW